MSNVFAAGPVARLFGVCTTPNLLRVLLAFCLCQATAGLAREPEATPEEVGLSTERLARFADYTEAMVEAGKIPGATIAVSRFGKLAYYETIGWADVDERKPTRADTLYRLHSMTKPLFAVATMTLVEEGRLGLREPLSKYIPEFADVKVLVGGTPDAPVLESPKSAPTIGQLLSQTAGIATGGDLFAEKTIAEIYTNARIHEGNPNAEEVAQRIARLPLAGHPGEIFVYGLSFDVLARVLEVASGQPLDDFISQRLLDPLRMEDTYFFVDPAEQLIGAFFTQVYPGGTYDLRESLQTFTYQALID